MNSTVEFTFGKISLLCPQQLLLYPLQSFRHSVPSNSSTCSKPSHCRRLGESRKHDILDLFHHSVIVLVECGRVAFLSLDVHTQTVLVFEVDSYLITILAFRTPLYCTNPINPEPLHKIPKLQDFRHPNALSK